jgi:hypothetical protein
MVSLRSLRSVAISLTISLSSAGGNEDVDMVALVAVFDLGLAMLELVRRVQR